MAPRESKTLEFKEEVTATFLKTVSAYANFGGGRILFGVRDDGTPAGIEDPNAECLDIENRINDGLSPVPPIDGASRIPVELVPEKAFREAIANAIVHRTWDVDAAIPVSLFRDHIAIASPGGLPSGLSEDEYLHNPISMLRNPKLANVFFRLGYIEKFGTGIRRIKNAYADAAVKPAFRVYAESIQVVLPVIGVGNGLGADERRVLDALSDNRVLTRAEIGEATGYNKAKLLRVIPRLLEKNVIAKVGTGRGTKYTGV